MSRRTPVCRLLPHIAVASLDLHGYPHPLLRKHEMALARVQ